MSLIASSESQRLTTLKSYGLLDTAPEYDLDQVVWLAAHLADCPMATISLVDEKRQWFKARLGLAEQETPREVAFCAHALEGEQQLIVKNALRDKRFARNPLVLGAPYIRFYLGTPLVSPRGDIIGTLCVMDTRPRRPEQDLCHGLQVLARQVMQLFELRRLSRQMAVSRQAASA
jgi:GAF domain-containing protein